MFSRKALGSLSYSEDIPNEMKKNKGSVKWTKELSEQFVKKKLEEKLEQEIENM